MLAWYGFGLAAAAWVLLANCRPPGIGSKQGEDAKQAHGAFVAPRWKKVVGSDIHCVGGDGLGIMTAMVVTRLLGLSFWPEFWTEYVIGFLFDWLLFQATAMRHMGNSWPMGVWKGGRAEFFSMISDMAGMGLVMRFVTPPWSATRPRPTPRSGA